MPSEIPQKYKLFAQYVAQRARACGLNQFTGTFRPGFEDDFTQEITISWSAGRHGADSHKVTLSFSERMALQLDEQPSTATSTKEKT